MSNSLVDVLLPVFNAAQTLENTLDSLLRQTIPNIRIIFIDDGSTDCSLNIATRYARIDRRIKVIAQSNRGIVDALNLGLKEGGAEFVARQDADDISLPNRLELELDYLKQHHDCIGISGAVEHIDGQGRPTGHVERFSSPDECDPFWAPSREPYLIHPFLMARRSEMVAISGYRYVFHSEDTDLYWRLRERGRLHNLSTVLGYYRMHANSISSGSVVNGRIMALNSQLAALSARRRRMGRADIHFPKEAISDYSKAGALSKIYELGVKQLDDEESRYLRIAISGKMLELSAYRPYEIEIDDCRFIRKARGDFSVLSRKNCKQLDRMYAAAAVRLLQKRLYREAAALSPRSLYPSIVARLVAIGVLPNTVIQYISRLRALQ